MEKADYKLLLPCPSGLSSSQVSVVFDQSYDRIPHPDIELENSIAKIWDQRAEKNTTLYNGKKFRYGGYNVYNEGGLDKVSHVGLLLGLTDYRTFVGTNLNPSWERFLVSSQDDSIRCEHMSSPLGNGAVIETSDKKIVVLQRSDHVGEFPGHFVFPGGHPEPEEVGIASHQSSKNFTDSEMINRKVSQEMFDSIIREVVEEIGVPATSLCDPLFIGISCRVLNARPAIFFFIRCCLLSEEIQQLYRNAQDGYESTQLYTVSLIDLENIASKMPGCHQGGFALYKMMVEAVKNS
ncbi:nudix hydrolase 9 isoform X1 [Ricinus communis]|uniref:nudix hydrolase 9 isoform X1 n=1 Tax=Ricinus communis TaxID=3988 RepID=UPI00077299B5|nr:nudix hydrolase 9 isoform X1 [Ricinus communis]|eukprot:XP_015583855.1 nudix hydrolase 9 isoform X1 [Ricinus communis]